METSVVDKTTKQAKEYMNELANKTQSKLNNLESSVEDLRSKVNDGSEVARKRALESRDEAQKMIVASPFKAIFGALFLGLTLGFLFKKSNKK